MKKLFIGILFLMISTFAFADTLYVVKRLNITSTYIKVYENMKKTIPFLFSNMNDNEYYLTESGLYYKVNGQLYLTTMFELEID